MPVTSRNRGLRSTRQGDLVRAELTRDTAFRSAQAIFARVRGDGGEVGLSTVYRHLQALADAGTADTVQNGEGEVLYRLCGAADRHHHHLVCRTCGHTVEIEGPGVERWAEQTAAAHGFTGVDHTVELLGLCRDCTPPVAGVPVQNSAS